MNGKTKKPQAAEIARSALRRAAGPGEPDVGRLLDALPEIQAEARRRRAAQTPVDPVLSIMVSLARSAIPHLAAAAAMLVLAATFFGFRDSAEPATSSADLDQYILTGEMGDDVSDLLLEALVEQGKDHG